MHDVFISRWFSVLTLFLVLLSAPLRAERFTSDSIERIGERIEDFFDAKKGAHDPKSAIVAFDFDDTLLSTKQVLGSEKWFTWQELLLAETNAEKKKGLIAKDFNELLDIQQRILGLIRFEPTEERTVAVVKRIQELGAEVVLCTSRGATDYTATFRELKRAGLDFSGAKSAKEFGRSELPFTVDKPEEAGLTKEELAAWKIKADPRPITFQSGLLLTEGQHKGAMLRALVHRSAKKFTSLLFVDNREKHVDRVEKAFPKEKMDTLTVFYTKIDPESPSFDENSPKPNPFEDWKRIEPLIR